MNDIQYTGSNSPVHVALGEAVDDTTDDATEDMLVEVLSNIWYGFDSADDIAALIDEHAASRDSIDIAMVEAVAAKEFAKKRSAEAGWPQDTDCDRLDRAFALLEEQGICAVQWAGDTLDDSLECIEDRVKDEDLPQGHYSGFCFFHSQDMDHAFNGEGLMLAFGVVESDGGDSAEYIRVARLVIQALEQEGLSAEWNGSAGSRIWIPTLRWQRRTPD